MEFIYEIKKNLSSEVCKTIIRKFEDDPRKEPGRTLRGVVPEIKKSTDLRISTLPEWKDIDTILFECLRAGLSEYMEHIKSLIKDTDPGNILITFSSIKDSGYQIQRMKQGEFYIWHHDGDISEKRLITFIWYLNTLEQEDGGATDFLCGKFIQPSEGTLVFFPALWSYIHRGREVTSRTKYICTGFICEKKDIP